MFSRQPYNQEKEMRLKKIPECPDNLSTFFIPCNWGWQKYIRDIWKYIFLHLNPCVRWWFHPSSEIKHIFLKIQNLGAFQLILMILFFPHFSMTLISIKKGRLSIMFPQYLCCRVCPLSTKHVKRTAQYAKMTEII